MTELVITHDGYPDDQESKPWLQPCCRCGASGTGWGATFTLHDPSGRKLPEKRRYCAGCAVTVATAPDR